MWFGEFCCCCCLPLLPQLACSILPTTYKDFLRALYICKPTRWSNEYRLVRRVLDLKMPLYPSFHLRSGFHCTPAPCNEMGGRLEGGRPGARLNGPPLARASIIGQPDSLSPSHFRPKIAGRQRYGGLLKRRPQYVWFFNPPTLHWANDLC